MTLVNQPNAYSNIRIKTALTVAISALRSMGIPFTADDLIQEIKALCRDDEDLYSYTMCLLTLAAGELLHAHANPER